mgnify:CR=1 FL=1
MAGTLLIHIGMPKTGTTALQNFMLNNNDKLEKHGWCYPVLSGNSKMDDLERWELETVGNGYKMYDALIESQNVSEWDKGMNILLKFLKNRNVILSTEYIYEHGTEEFIENIKKSICDRIYIHTAIIYMINTFLIRNFFPRCHQKTSIIIF